MRLVSLFVISILILSLLITNCRKDLSGLNDTIPEPDTTSHNFSWTVDTLGGYRSIVCDIAMIDENDIWAVGQFYFQDSAGQDTANYNTAHWNGAQWNFKFIPSVIYTGDTIFNHIGIHAVYALDKNNLWFASSSGGYMNLKNSTIEMGYLRERYGQIIRIWGTGPENLYFIGTHGNITHYDGSSFTKLYSRNNMEFWDIDGDEERVFVLGRELYGPNSMLVEISCGNTNEIYYSDNANISIEDGRYGKLESLDWFNNELIVKSTAGLLMFSSKLQLNKIIKTSDSVVMREGFISTHYIAENDALCQTGSGALVHYNGNTWIKDSSVENYFSSSYYQVRRADYKSSYFISGGYGSSSNCGIIVKGKHN